jgi:hypothetical protein
VSHAVQGAEYSRYQPIGETDVEIPSFSGRLFTYAGLHRIGVRTSAAAYSSGWTHLRHRSTSWAARRLEATDDVCLSLEHGTTIPLRGPDNPPGTGRRHHRRGKAVLGCFRANVAYWSGRSAWSLRRRKWQRSLGLGLGANVLVGGSHRTISLQPLSVEGQLGINLALGVAGLTLQ